MIVRWLAVTVRALAVLATVFWMPLAAADVAPGASAPQFRLTDTAGNAVSLAEHRGKIVVLEWVNFGCPFVAKHYGSGNMQSLQKKYRARDVVWLSIQSTHPGHPDYEDPASLAASMRAKGGTPSATLLDPDGSVGRLYGAKTTPHMYVVDPKGVLAYAGAIDDRRSANPEDVKTANNHVAAALDALQAGRAVVPASTVPYGCSVKYR